MGIADRIWDALAHVIKMNEQVVRLSVQVRDLAAEMREMDKRLARLEAMLEIALSGKGRIPPGALPPRRVPSKAPKN